MKNRYYEQGDSAFIQIKRKEGPALFTEISLQDLPRAKQFPHTWCATYKKHLNRFYITGTQRNNDGTSTTIQLHRFLLQCPKGLYVDHINGDSLNNTRENLRIVTNSENLQNRTKLNANNTSGVRGVHFDRIRNKWEVKFRKEYKTIHYGRFNSLEEATKVANKAIAELFEHLLSKEGER